ncbi:hyaluronidase-4 isoform 1-T1 [Menidia menidia]
MEGSGPSTTPQPQDDSSLQLLISRMPAMRVGGIHHTLPAALTYSWLLPLLNATFGQKPAKLPLIPRKPFIAAWNVPLDMCSIKYNVTANIDPLFHIKGSPRVSWTGQNVTIFYANRLGYYPHYSPQGNAINGGVPQNCSLDMHLFKVYQDILHFIPAQDFRGLAVIDWEFWRPQWSRNWHKKEIYRRKSKELTLKAYLNVTAAQVETLAKRRFEKSARAFMQRTIQLGTRLRPNGLWGFYLYPDCHNYNLHEQDYTGLCPLLERLRNDELAWLWNSSTALFPSVAFRKMHTDSISNLHFSQHRIREALRIASMTAKDYDLPTYVYLRLAYRDDAMAFLTTKDLIHTIGESAALGAAGFVIWGDLNLTSSQHNCTEVKSYLSRRLGRYITNVTRAAEVCSSFLCGGHGRCVRRDPCAGHYLHLSARDYQILPAGDGGFSVSGWPSQQELQLLASRFHCHCYQGHQGPRCISSNRVREQEHSRGGEEEDTQRRRAEWEREQAGQTERANSSAGPSARRGGFILWVIFNLVFMKCCDHFST